MLYFALDFHSDDLAHFDTILGSPFGFCIWFSFLVSDFDCPVLCRLLGWPRGHAMVDGQESFEETGTSPWCDLATLLRGSDVAQGKHV